MHLHSYLLLSRSTQGRKAADLFRTYGYARFEILAAAMNALILMAVAFYILYEAYQRLSSLLTFSLWVCLLWQSQGLSLILSQ